MLSKADVERYNRDGVIVEEVGYLGKPEDVRIIPAAASLIRAANDHGIRVVVGSGLHAMPIGVVSDRLRDGRRGEVLGVRGRDLPDWGGHEQRA